MIFLFVAEDRDLLLTAKPGTRERERYQRHYSMDRLRSLAERRRGSPHGDLWRGLSLAFSKLSSDGGCPELGLPALGSFLWSDKATPDVDRSELANADLLQTIRSLAFTVEGGVRRVTDYKNLGPEELGSVYESLLELHPEVNADAPSFKLTTAAGHERKTTGSYYTPTSLVECLLDSALDPVLDEAAKQLDPQKAILNLKICDPACGSGHFLIAAAHRIANCLAGIRTGDEEPSPEAIRTALRDVIGRCLYGVDVNPMAVELCKVNLWLEALEPGKPLSFLEHHIQCGNSLLGATPALLKKGIPDEAFDPIEGDDKEYCKKYRKENKKEREGRMSLFQPSLRTP
jgi:type I restriction-modification system DNA methylase subunit